MKCPNCDGVGRVPDYTGNKPCKKCQGTGLIPWGKDGN